MGKPTFVRLRAESLENDGYRVTVLDEASRVVEIVKARTPDFVTVDINKHLAKKLARPVAGDKLIHSNYGVGYKIE